MACLVLVPTESRSETSFYSKLTQTCRPQGAARMQTQGPPGKRGPKGEPGPQGQKARTSCYPFRFKSTRVQAQRCHLRDFGIV